MQNYFLIEFYFEEISFNLKEHLKHCINLVFMQFLSLNDYKNHYNIEFVTTAQRVIFIINFNEEIELYKKGVNINNSKDKLKFFMNKYGVNSVDALVIQDEKYCIRKIINSEEILLKIEKNIENIIYNILLNINMKNSSSLLLNLKNIFCLNNDKIVEINFNNLDSSSTIIINNKNIEINNKNEYFDILQQNHIYSNKNQFKKYINDYINKLQLNIANNNLNNFIDKFINKSDELLFNIGKIKYSCSELYLQILQEYLKNDYLFYCIDDYIYFIYFHKANNLVSKTENDEANKYHINKVENTIIKLNNIINNYEEVRYYQNNNNTKIFNIDKNIIMSQIIKYISIWIPYCDVSKLEHLLQYDFIFNETKFKNKKLEKLIKYYIIVNNTKYNNIANIFLDYLDNNSKIPLNIAIKITNYLLKIINLNVDKVLFHTYNIKNENKLYKQLIELIIKNNIKIPLKIILNHIFKIFINLDTKIKQNKKIIKIERINPDFIVKAILESIYSNLYNYIKKNKIYNSYNNITSAIINNKIQFLNKHNSVILEDYKYIRLVVLFFRKKSNLEFIQLYKRINNLLAKYTKRKKVLFKKNLFKPKKFKTDFDEELTTLINHLFTIIKDKNIHYYEFLKNLHKAKNLLNDFLDNIYLNKSNYFLKKKRIVLLLKYKILFNKILDFSKIKL